MVSVREGIALHRESLMNSDSFHLRGRHNRLNSCFAGFVFVLFFLLIITAVVSDLYADLEALIVKVTLIYMIILFI